MCTKLCSYSRQHLSLFVRDRPQTRGSKGNEEKLTRSFDFTFRFIDDNVSLNNSKFCDYVERIYLFEVEIRDTTDRTRSASCVGRDLEMYSGTIKIEALRQNR